MFDPMTMNVQVLHITNFFCIPVMLCKMNAGAVTLTDCVFWFILVPVLTIRGYTLNFVSILLRGFTVIVDKVQRRFVLLIDVTFML